MKTRFGTTICAIASRLQDAARYESAACAVDVPPKKSKGHAAARDERARLAALADACFANALEAEEMFEPTTVGI
jgi:hypothetical protein